jgi:hypothetical protein
MINVIRVSVSWVFVILLNVILLSVIKMTVILPIVVLLNVTAPCGQKQEQNQAYRERGILLVGPSLHV